MADNENVIWVINTYDIYDGFKSIGYVNTLDSAKTIVANYLLQNTDLSANRITTGIAKGLEYMREHEGSHFRVSFTINSVTEYIDAMEIGSLEPPVEIEVIPIDTIGDNCTCITL